MDTTMEIRGSHMALKSTSNAATIAIAPSICEFILVSPLFLLAVYEMSATKSLHGALKTEIYSGLVLRPAILFTVIGLRWVSKDLLKSYETVPPLTLFTNKLFTPSTP